MARSTSSTYHKVMGGGLGFELVDRLLFCDEIWFRWKVYILLEGLRWLVVARARALSVLVIFVPDSNTWLPSLSINVIFVLFCNDSNSYVLVENK